MVVEVPHLTDAEEDRYSCLFKASMLVLHGGVV